MTNLTFTHTVTITQQPNGDTILSQETTKEGLGQMSEQMRQAMGAYYSVFAEFFTYYKPDAPPMGLVATPGNVRRFELGEGL